METVISPTSVNHIFDNLYLTSFDGAVFFFNQNLSAKFDFLCILVAREMIPFYNEINCNKIICMPLDDIITENIFVWFETICKIIETNKKTMLICQMGISRSASFCIAYVMQKLSLSFVEAYKFVKNKRNIIYPNTGFQQQLVSYERNLFGR